MLPPEPEKSDGEKFYHMALTACYQAEMNLPDDECLKKMRPFYDEAQKMIEQVKNVAEIYRGLDLNKFEYQRFIKDLTQSPPLKNRPLGRLDLAGQERRLRRIHPGRGT